VVGRKGSGKEFRRDLNHFLKKIGPHRRREGPNKIEKERRKTKVEKLPLPIGRGGGKGNEEITGGGPGVREKKTGL